MQHEPVVRARDDHVDAAPVPPVGDDPLQHLAHPRRDLLRVRAPGDRLPHHRLHIGVAQHGQRPAQCRGELGGDPVGVLGHGEPRAQPAADADGAQPAPYDVLGEEVLPHELAQRDAELVLLGGDDRGVRDGQAERVTEERGDGEPVGERAHHPGLRRRGHVVGPGAGARVSRPGGEDVHQCDEQQQPDRVGLHPPYATPLLLVGGAEDVHGPAGGRARRTARAAGGRARRTTRAAGGRARRFPLCFPLHPLHHFHPSGDTPAVIPHTIVPS